MEGGQGLVEGALGIENRQQAMSVQEMEEWRIARRKNKCKVACSNNKLMVRTRMIYKRNMKDGEVEKYECRLVA